MQLTLWGEQAPRPKRKRKIVPLLTQTPYSITGTSKDCEIIGHTTNIWDLAGCTTYMSCGVKIFCPRCVKNHPQDEKAVPVLCNRHSESTVSA